jgi:hypothetical protein
VLFVSSRAFVYPHFFVVYPYGRLALWKTVRLHGEKLENVTKPISNQSIASNLCDMGSFNNYVEKRRWVGG